MYRSRLPRILACFVILACRAVWGQPTVEETMDGIVTRLYATHTEEELARLDEASILSFITPEERRVLATRHCCFDVSGPSIVSVLRDTAQAVVPFWLPEAGFERTDMVVKNMEGWVYEVWQKPFETGRVELGINGFDKHRPHYLVAVGPRDGAGAVEIANLHPAGFTIVELAPGAMCYHDWSDLVLIEVPEAIRGHKLLTTIRGRAREAHLVGAFRKTPFPSSKEPDHVILTWSEDPRTSQTIQWRTNTEAEDGVVLFREKDGPSQTDGPVWRMAAAERFVMEDRLLMNDRYIHRFTATLRGLQPDTVYVYKVGSTGTGVWSEESEFKTGPAGPGPFAFVYFGDTHRSPEWGKLLDAAFERHPETAFYTIAGDLVSTGLYRDDWDHLFAYSWPVFKQRPVMPSIGNHDDQDGLGCWMYLEMFGLPKNGPAPLEPERAYSFRYGNALILVLDATSEVSDQTEWLRDQLASTDAAWKFAVFHFPPYCLNPSFDEDYVEIRTVWGALFDEYHVDMVFTGHVHHYMRTYPIRAGQRVESPADGTIYVTSVAIPGRGRTPEKPAHAAAAFVGDATYQLIEVDENRLKYTAFDLSGAVRDELVIER